MSDPVRRMPPSDGERTRQIDRQAHSARGITRWTRNVPESTPVGRFQATFQEVYHGDDPNVLRPPVKRVQWVGVAFPNNGTALDFWIPANLDPGDL